jgi:predicted dehydrogenase
VLGTQKTVSDLEEGLSRINAAAQVAVIGTLTSGVTASIRVREAVAGGTGFLWEINGTDGTLRVTADVAQPQIFLHRRWTHLDAARGKKRTTVAVAGELACFVWEIANQTDS